MRSILRNGFAVLLCAGSSAVYISHVARVYRAQRSANSLQIEGLERAVRLLPDDAEFAHELGLQLSAEGRDRNAAIASLHHAAILNPNNARYWLDLAAAYLATDNTKKKDDAVESALRAEPGNPQVDVEAAAFFLMAGNADRALPLFRAALGKNPADARTVLLTCWRSTKDANRILTQVVADSPELQLELLAVLARENEADSAQQVWQHLVSSGRPFEPKLAFFYFDYLRHEHDAADFEHSWHDMAAIAPAIRPYLPNENLMVNPGFELPLLNAGFDWRHEPVDHIIAGIDNNVAHSGSNSLSLTYDGELAADAGWTQFVPVQSNATYEFAAWIKSENVISAAGPRIAIADAFSGENLFLTDDVLDTHPWHELKATVQIPADTQLLTIKIVRDRANTRIRGRVWFDDFRLVKR